MANSVPTLTNENWHMFEPSQLETTLAARVGSDPSNTLAFPLMMSARFRGENAGMNYQAQVDQMHRAQIAEALMAQQTARNGQMSTSLKDAATSPGMTDVYRQLGILPQGVDTAGFDAGTQAAASAKNLGEGGRGLGALAMGGFTGLAPAAQGVAGPGVEQGPSALERAAVINANGRVAASGNGPGMANISVPVGKPSPNQPTVRFHVPTGSVPGLPFVGGGASNLTAPIDDGSDGIAGNPLLGGIPGVSSQLADKGVAARPAGTMPAQPTATKSLDQVRQSVAEALPHLAQTNKDAHADIVAGGMNIMPNSTNTGFVIKGASGKLYDANGF